MWNHYTPWKFSFSGGFPKTRLLGSSFFNATLGGQTESPDFACIGFPCHQEADRALIHAIVYTKLSVES